MSTQLRDNLLAYEIDSPGVLQRTLHRCPLTILPALRKIVDHRPWKQLTPLEKDFYFSALRKFNRDLILRRFSR